MNVLSASDLFCGAGGFSAGLLAACEDLNRRAELLAINHWPKAIATHSLNHPGVGHLCENLDNVDPRKVVKSGRLDILLASPECTHHSRARGGKPMSDQSRASAWHVLRWCEALRVENVLVENVKEFESWGPLDSKGRPMKSKRGELFRKFCECFEAMGYYVDYRVLNSADYGAATTRERLFVQATRRRRPRWPERTHSAKPDLFDSKPYRAAREIIDWDLEGQSIFGRKKPLSEKTMKRIMAGLKKFGGVDFVLGQQSCSAPRDLGQPIPTVATAGAISFVQPFLVVLRNNADGRSLDTPMPTLCAGGGHFGLCEPFLVKFHGDHKGREDGAQRVHSVHQPLKTLDTSNRYGLAEPFLVKFKNFSDACSIHEPLGTLTTKDVFGLAQPFFVQYYGNSTTAHCDEPLPTVTTHDRFGLCEPEPVAVMEREGVTYAVLDIKFRMLQPHELAAAMGLDGYKFPEHATKADRTKMVGNAVEKNTSRALCRAVLQ